MPAILPPKNPGAPDASAPEPHPSRATLLPAIFIDDAGEALAICGELQAIVEACGEAARRLTPHLDPAQRRVIPGTLDNLGAFAGALAERIRRGLPFPGPERTTSSL